jgi:hypothetical protein
MMVVFVIIGTISLFFAFSEHELKWLALAGSALFYTKACLSFVLRRYSMTGSGQKAPPTQIEWRIVMCGYLLSAALCLVSGVSGEGWIGYIGAPTMLLLGVVFWFVAKKSESVHKPAGI